MKLNDNEVGGKENNACHIHIHGDREIGNQYLGIARNMLGELKYKMSFNSLTSGKMVKTFTDYKGIDGDIDTTSAMSIGEAVTMDVRINIEVSSFKGAHDTDSIIIYVIDKKKEKVIEEWTCIGFIIQPFIDINNSNKRVNMQVTVPSKKVLTNNIYPIWQLVDVIFDNYPDNGAKYYDIPDDQDIQAVLVSDENIIDEYGGNGPHTYRLGTGWNEWNGNYVGHGVFHTWNMWAKGEYPLLLSGTCQVGWAGEWNPPYSWGVPNGYAIAYLRDFVGYVALANSIAEQYYEILLERFGLIGIENTIHRYIDMSWEGSTGYNFKLKDGNGFISESGFYFNESIKHIVLTECGKNDYGSGIIYMMPHGNVEKNEAEKQFSYEQIIIDNMSEYNDYFPGYINYPNIQWGACEVGIDIAAPPSNENWIVDNNENHLSIYNYYEDDYEVTSGFGVPVKVDYGNYETIISSPNGCNLIEFNMYFLFRNSKGRELLLKQNKKANSNSHKINIQIGIATNEPIPLVNIE